MKSTTRTVLGFVKAVGRRLNPFAGGTRKLEDIYNYRLVDDAFATSGQPDEQQFQLIKDAGFDTVINLAPSSVLENSLKDEEEILRALALTYVHIPVDFKNPTEEDFAEFVAAVENTDRQRLWVHCAANMRVSAFTYRYRRDVLGVAPETASADLQAIWEPFGVWKEFLK